MKIFEFNWNIVSGEKDWWCDEDLESAKKNYINFTGCNDLDGCRVSEVSKKECEHAWILDLDDPQPDSIEEAYDEDEYLNGYRKQQSFKDYLTTATVPDMVATTNY